MPLNFGISLSADPFIGFLGDLGESFDAKLDDPNLRAGFDQADDVYMEQQRELFAANGAGGGEWPELAEMTQRDRKELGYNPTRPILVRESVLAAAMQRGAPGSVFRIERDEVVSGFGGDDMHPGYGSNPTPTISIAAIAAIHQNGRGNVPKRQILHLPQGSLLEDMTRPVSDGFRELIFAAVDKHNGV